MKNDFRVQIIVRSEMIIKVNEIGRVINGMSDPPDAISEERKLTSAKGHNTSPMIKGAIGILSFSMKNPKTPKASITQTSKNRLFNAKDPITQKTRMVGVIKAFGISTIFAIP